MFTFQELGGSPREKYTIDGFSATRQFLVPWEQRSEFSLAVFGTTSQPLLERRLVYPGRSDVLAYSLDFEPLEPDSICARTLENLKTDLVDYNGSFAKATVNYRTTTRSDRADVPINEEGTYITYRMVVGSEDMLLSSNGWNWYDTSIPVSSDTQIIKKLPFTEHIVTWSEVVDPPWNAITALQGKINSQPFIGCAAGTLLFRGAEANKLYRRDSGIEDEPASFVWSIKYTFQERSVKMNDRIYGWNYYFWKITGTWMPVCTNGSFLYDSGDFSELFHSVQP